MFVDQLSQYSAAIVKIGTMPRLTDRHYLKAHRQLRHFWLKADVVYGYLTPQEQWQLHDFFQPSKDWSESKLLEHRKATAKQRPNLPHQAGRALAKLDEHAVRYALKRVRQQVPSGGSRKQGQRGKITVRAVVRREIDTERLARALLAIAKEQIRAEQEEREDQAS